MVCGLVFATLLSIASALPHRAAMLAIMKSDDAAAAVMPHLLLPTWTQTYNLSRSTITQTCQSPGQSLDYLRDWGVISYDWSNMASVWHRDAPNNCDQKVRGVLCCVVLYLRMLLMCSLQDGRPGGQGQEGGARHEDLVYRNLAQAYAEFTQIREKLEDRRYSGWFLPFGVHNDESVTPRCTVNPRTRKKLCSDLFHWAGQRPGGDCGDKIPCGWYQWDHRNQSLRTWIVQEFMMGSKLGMGNASVDGYLIDDWWSPGGPSEVKNMENGTGLAKNSTEFVEIWRNWSITTWESEKAINAAGGFTWSGLNCMLTKESGYGGSPVDLNACGLDKTEGVSTVLVLLVLLVLILPVCSTRAPTTPRERRSGTTR